MSLPVIEIKIDGVLYETLECAAVRLGVSSATVRRFAKQGLLKRRKLYGLTLFSLASVEELGARRDADFAAVRGKRRTD